MDTSIKPIATSTPKDNTLADISDVATTSRKVWPAPRPRGRPWRPISKEAYEEAHRLIAQKENRKRSRRRLSREDKEVQE